MSKTQHTGVRSPGDKYTVPGTPGRNSCGDKYTVPGTPVPGTPGGVRSPEDKYTIHGVPVVPGTHETPDIKQLQNYYKPYAVRFSLFHFLAAMLLLFTGGIGLKGILGGKEDVFMAAVLNLTAIIFSLMLQHIAYSIYTALFHQQTAYNGLCIFSRNSIVSRFFYILFSHGKALYQAIHSSRSKSRRKLGLLFPYVTLICIIATIIDIGVILASGIHSTYFLYSYYIVLLISSQCVMIINSLAFIFYFRIIYDGMFWKFTV